VKTGKTGLTKEKSAGRRGSVLPDFRQRLQLTERIVGTELMCLMRRASPILSNASDLTMRDILGRRAKNASDSVSLFRLCVVFLSLAMRSLQCRLLRRTMDAVSICLTVMLASVALTNAALAERPSNAQTADTTMQVFVAIANLAGAPIPKEAVPVVQGMVTCALANTSLPDCVKNIAISTALSQVAKSGGANSQVSSIVSEAVTCLTGGSPAQICLTKAAVSQLPVEAQPLANCIGSGGNLGDCAQKAALTVATQQLGANLPPEVAATVQCVIGGGKLPSCASSLVTDGVNKALKASGAPPEVINAVNGMVTCVGGGGNAGDCAKSVAINNIPAGSAKDLATCMNAAGANAQTCVANFAANNISDPTAKAVVGCMGQTSGDKVQQCIATNAKQALGDATSQAAQQALVTAAETIAKLDLGAPIQVPPKFPEQPAILQNIMSVANGIQKGDWSLVVKGVGAQAAEVASQIILSIFLTPALANVLAPVVESMIQNDINAFTNALDHLKKGDAVGVAADIFKWYETTFIQAPCALMPDGAFKNSVCNGLADGINWVAAQGSELAKGILGIGKDILQALGLWNLVDDIGTTVWKSLTSVIGDIGKFIGLGGKSETKVVCVGFPSPADYFANNVVNSCLASAASNAAAATPVSMSQSAVNAVVGKCTSLYGLCATNDEAKAAVQANCGKMGSALNQMASSTAAAMRQGASGYAQTAVATFAAKKYAEYKKKGNPEDICSTGFWSANLGEFAASCAAVVGAKLNVPAADNLCPFRPTYDSAAKQACITMLTSSGYLTDAAAGPRGALCKKFKEDALKNPCQFTDKKTIVLPSGQVIAANLECRYIKPAWDLFHMSPLLHPQKAPFVLQPHGGVLVHFNPADLPRLLHPSPIPSGSGGNGGIGWRPGMAAIPRLPSGETGSRIRPAGIPRIPDVVMFPNRNTGGGSGGITARPSVRIPNTPSEGQAANGGSGGGINMPRGGNAMDTLGNLNTGGGLSSAAGSGSGGISDRPRPGALPPAAGVPRRPPVGPDPAVQAKAPSGGSGGIGLTNGQSGNAPIGKGGSNTTNSQSGNAPSGSRFTPVTKLKVKPPPDWNIDYGGCSGCGKPAKDPLVVR
jgi:hypothetical protein